MSVVEELVKVALKELWWRRGWLVSCNEALRFYQSSVWQIAVVAQPDGMIWQRALCSSV